MPTIRRRAGLVASLALAFWITAILLRPLPVHSAPSKPAVFVFGPVFVPMDADVAVVVTNTGSRPTPLGHIVISQAINGSTLISEDVLALAPGHGSSVSFNAAQSVEATAVLTFDAPAAGQAVPKPLAATLQVVGSTGTIDAILNPQASAGE